MVHLLILEAFQGPRPEGTVTRHLDGDKTNNRLSNLRRGTPAENSQDAMRHGTHIGTERAARTHCKQGHLFSEANTYVATVDGRFRARKCRTCVAESNRRSYQRRAAKRVAA